MVLDPTRHRGEHHVTVWWFTDPSQIPKRKWGGTLPLKQENAWLHDSWLEATDGLMFWWVQVLPAAVLGGNEWLRSLP